MKALKMRGRKPVPTVLKKIRGNPSKTPENVREPIPVGDLVAAPEWMTADQTAGWNYAITNAPPGLLRIIDRSALAVWVVAESLHVEACKFQARAGLLTRVGVAPPRARPGEVQEPDNRVLQQSPFLAIINKQAFLMLKAAAELGFTPASRSRVQTAANAVAMGQGGTVAGPAKKGEPHVALEDYLAAAPGASSLH